MAQKFERVRPGDLITSDLINLILKELETLIEKVDDLGKTMGQINNAVAITSLLPSGPYRVFQEMQIIGRNFDFFIGSARVLIGSKPVFNFKSGSDDSHLIFDIPDLGIAIPTTGRELTLSVRNQSSVDTRTIIIFPAEQTLQGNADVKYLSVEPKTMTAGNPATFKYELTSRTNIDAIFTINHSISVDINQNLWESGLQVLDDQLNVIPSRRISLEAGEVKEFHIRINPIPIATTGTGFSLTVDASAIGVISTPSVHTFTVGQETIPPDETITMTFTSTLPLGVHSDGVLSISPGGGATVILSAEFEDSGKYDVSVSPVGTLNNWEVRLSTHPPTPNEYTITEEEVAGSEKGTRQPRFVLTAGATGASPSGMVEFRIKHQERTSWQSIIFNLALST